jgi:hypothetical protein
VFHVVGCRFIHDKATERTVTAGRAMQDGYVPCTRCLREYLPAASLTERAVVEAEIGEDGQGDAEVRAGH